MKLYRYSRLCIACVWLLGAGLAGGRATYAQETEDVLRARVDSLSAEVVRRYNAGRYRQATPIAREVLSILERVLGPDHPDVATSLINLALLLRDQGDYAGARPLYERALSIYEAALGPDHPGVAQTLNDLALLHWTQGDYATARPLYERALSIRERALGPDHPLVAQSLNNLALLLRDQGDYAGARPLYERALSIKETTLGADHPTVATGLNNLAVLLQAQGDYAEARPLLERALSIYETALGPDHPNVAAGLNNLAALLEHQGDYAAARPLYERALSISEAALGPNHPDVARSLNNLAALLQAQGDYATARPLHQRALSIMEVSLGPDHPLVAQGLNNLAMLLREQGDYAGARPLLERALSIRERVLGPEHADVAQSLHNLALLLEDQGDYAGARPLYERALSLMEASLGPNHPSVAHSLSNLAAVLGHQGDYAAARPLMERALSIRERALGPDHPSVALALHNLGWLLEAQGAYDQALARTSQAIDLFDATPAYPAYRVAAYQQRARLHKRAGRSGEALNDLEEALRAAEELRPQVGGSEETRASFFQRYAEAFDTMVHWRVEDGALEQAFTYAERGRARVLLDQLAAGKIDIRASIPDDIRAPLEAREADARARLAEYQQRITLTRAREDLPTVERLRRLGAYQDSLRLADRDYKQVYAEIKNASPLWRDQITSGGRPVDLATVQRRLVPAQGLMLMYQLGVEQSYLFVIPPGRQAVDAWPLSISEEAASVFGLEGGPLTAEVLAQMLGPHDGPEAGRTGLLSRLGERRDAAGGAASAFPVAEALHALWRVLIPDALTERLMASEEVVVVPDGALFYLPFEALVVEPVGEERAGLRYWLDAGPVVRYAPSVTVLATITQRPQVRGVPSASAAPVLSLSDAVFNPAEVDSLAAARQHAARAAEASSVPSVTRDRYERVGGLLKRLPGTARETEAIAAAYGPEAGRALVRLQGLTAREPRLREALPEKRYLHLATHGLVDERRGALFASLALTPPAGATAMLEDDGFLQLHEIYALKLPEVELAVLSACATNVGDSVEGEGVFALSRGFLVAGARRVIASQWAVDDASTAALVQSLFEAIVAAERAGRAVDYARALRDARRAVRSQAPWSDPYYWAPFILMGER